MSTRAMAQHFSSGGGGRAPMQSLDLLGLRERKSNRMADADLARQIQLLQEADRIERETKTHESKLGNDSEISKSTTKLLSAHGLQDTPENRKAFNDLTSAIKLNNAKNMAGAESGEVLAKKRFFNSPAGSKAITGNLEATLGEQGVKNSAALKTTTPVGALSTMPINAPGFANVPSENNLLETFGGSETEVSIPGEPTVVGDTSFPGKPTTATVSEPGKVAFPVNMNRRVRTSQPLQATPAYEPTPTYGRYDPKINPNTLSTYGANSGADGDTGKLLQFLQLLQSLKQ